MTNQINSSETKTDNWWSKDAIGVGTFFAGVGTFIIGIAAIIALCQTRDVIKEVLKVQDQAKSISEAVQLLSAQLKELKAQNIVKSSSALQGPDPTPEEIREAIKDLPQNPIKGTTMIYLPKDDVDDAIELIQKAKTTDARAEALRKFLKTEKE